MKPDTITAGSHSRLKVFGSCKRHAKYKFVDKISEPDRGQPEIHKISRLPEFANDRGNRLHNNAEAFVQGKGPLHHELRHYALEYAIAKKLHAKGKAVTEEMWFFDKNWMPFTPKHQGDPRIYFRVKIDLLVHFNTKRALVVDLKSGGLFGHELEYHQQLVDYACTAKLLFPKLELINTELWLPDSNDIYQAKFTGDQATRLLRSLKARMDAMTNERAFPATPNYYSCRFCMYGPRYEGPCKVGMQ